MANGFPINHTEIGNKVLYNIQNHSVILEQLNKDYADELFVANPIGLKNQAIDIVRTLPQAPAKTFVNAIVKVPYNESSVKLVIDELFDKSHSFTVNEQNLNPGAITRAGVTAGDSCKDAMEIKALNEMAKVAKPISLPADGLASPEAYSILEKFMIDSQIKSSESVVFINSATRQKMTKATTLFAYSRNKDSKFSDGLGGNEEYETGTGYVTTEFGMNFYLSEKLSANYPYFTGMPAVEYPADVDFNKLYVAGTAKGGVSQYQEVAGGPMISILSLQLPDDTPEFFIFANTILEAGGALFKVTEDIHWVPPATSRGDVAIMIKSVTDPSNLTNGIAEQKPVNYAKNVQNMRNFILSKKSIAFACKAPAVVAPDQVVVADSVSGVATRVSSFYDGNTKELTISVDSWCGIKALFDDVGVFA